MVLVRIIYLLTNRDSLLVVKSCYQICFTSDVYGLDGDRCHSLSNFGFVCLDLDASQHEPT